MVFQDPYGSLNPRRTVFDTVSEPWQIHTDKSRSEIRREVDAVLDAVGLDQRFLDRRPQELSGGQRQRVSIARALALDPALVIADESTSALDVSVRAQILNLLRRLQIERGLTFVFISHDLSVVRHMSNRIAVMYLGRLVEIADRDTLFRNPAHPYTQALLSMVSIPDPTVERKRHRSPIAGEIPSPASPPSGLPFSSPVPARVRPLQGRDATAVQHRSPALLGVLSLAARDEVASDLTEQGHRVASAPQLMQDLHLPGRKDEQ